MNGTNGFNELDADRRIADWLENGPTTLSDATSRAIRVAIHTAPRKRGGNALWRYFAMPATKVALGATLIGVVLFGGLLAFRQSTETPGTSPATCEQVASATAPVVSSTSPASPAPSPADTSAWVRFTSSRYGYSMCIPADWTVTPGTAPWAPISSDPSENGAMDAFTAPAPDTEEFTVTSVLLPADMTEDQWFADYVAPAAAAGFPLACWPDRAHWGVATVDGHPAALHGGLPQCNFTEAVVIVDGRIYEIGGTPNPNALTNRVFDWGQLYAFLDTVTLDPSAADDSPAASPGSSPEASPGASPAASPS
jgi:hypothetical protein